MSVLRIEVKDLAIIELEICNRVMAVEGDSGTGKSLMIGCIKTGLSSLGDLKIEGCKSICAVSGEFELGNIQDVSGAVIFIDRYDALSLRAKKFLWDKMSKLDNTWIIMTRNVDFPNYGFTEDSFVNLKTSNKNGILYFEFYR